VPVLLEEADLARARELRLADELDAGSPATWSLALAAERSTITSSWGSTAERSIRSPCLWLKSRMRSGAAGVLSPV
jgi:hypothetical protein